MKYWIKIWDLPIRLFHWTLTASFIVSVLSIEIYDNIEVHFISGLVIFALVIFRLFWGFLGTATAKFSNFLPSLSSAFHYLKINKQQNLKIGHSPIAAFAVYAFLIALFAQSFSGLFSDDDIYFTGPLNRFASSHVIETMFAIHFYTSKLLFALVALHLIAIAWYFFKKKDNLIKPMITGRKELKGNDSDLKYTKQRIGKASVWLFIISISIPIAIVGYLYFLNS